MHARLPRRQSMTSALMQPFLAPFLALTLAACSSGLDDPKAGLSCIDDSKDCVEQRQATLKGMLADKERAWVKEQPTPEAHASGVRLFAFRSRKKELTCEELGVGRREADAAAKTMRGSQVSGLSPTQISRATLFATEVSKELATEMKARRCKA